jgi:hypothetical protein
MSDKIRFPLVGIFIANAFLISILSVHTQAQTKRRLAAPKSLLEVLEPEDRDCVLQSGLNSSVTVQAIQLAGRSRQILVRGSGLCLCGAQNCGFWIYRKTGNGYELLLKGIASVKVRAANTVAKGYRDIVSETHASANEIIVRNYRYDGRAYQLQRCVNRAYYDDNGKFTKEPNYRPCE